MQKKIFERPVTIDELVARCDERQLTWNTEGFDQGYLRFKINYVHPDKTCEVLFTPFSGKFFCRTGDNNVAIATDMSNDLDDTAWYSDLLDLLFIRPFVTLPVQPVQPVEPAQP